MPNLLARFKVLVYVKCWEYCISMWKLRSSKQSKSRSAASSGGDRVKILKKGSAMRVIFFYPGEEGTYVDNAEVVLYENGIVHIKSSQEESTTHLQNCEILWTFEVEGEDRANKVRLLKPKQETRGQEEKDSKSENKSPELV